MGQPSEFSLESVRQLMLASGGRVTNHDLVKCFRAWLTDPAGKEAARAQFKDYVNTLATIRQENGEKFLILKKKFYPEYYQGTSYLDTVTPAGYTPHHEAQTNGLAGEPAGQHPGEPASQHPEARRPGALPSSFYPEPQASARGSPSMLDEVMAGFAPPSRSLGRQLPALPGAPPFPTPSYTAPSPSYAPTPSYTSQNSYSQLPVQPFSQPPAPSYTQPPASYPQPPSSYSSQSSLSNYSSYSALPPSERAYPSYPQQGHHSVGLPAPPPGPHSLGLPAPPSNPRPYQRQASVDSLRGSRTEDSGYRGQRTEDSGYRNSRTEDTGYREGYREELSYNSGFNPHVKHSLDQAYPEPPRAYSDLSTPGQRLSTASYSSRTSRSSVGAPSQPAPRGSSALAALASLPPPGTRPPPLDHALSRPPPPYRAPPPDPVQGRPLPSRPSEPALALSPPPPPKRTSVAAPPEPAPPPLPRRPPASPPPREDKQVEVLSRVSEAQQPSPTDSGFTEDSRAFADLSNGRSKSYGNLSGEDKENRGILATARSLDELDSLPSCASLQEEEAISVRERTKTFNRLASTASLTAEDTAAAAARVPSAVKRRNSRAVDFPSRRGSVRQGGEGEEDAASITTIDPHVKQWMVAVAKADYQTAAKMLMEDPKLARSRDFTTGYTALHWACKHGNTDMVKLLAGTYQASTSIRTFGGYTPLHIAAQSNHQEVFDLLVAAYRADANVRDYAGKKPRQYMMDKGAEGLSLSMSNDTFRTLKDRRKTRTSKMEKNPSMLRFGSISVKVKKTTEAFNNMFGSSNGGEGRPKWEGGVSTGDKERMPPPKFAPVKKRGSKRAIDFGRTKSAPSTPTERSPVKEVILEEREEAQLSDSDSEYGFDGGQWGGGSKA